MPRDIPVGNGRLLVVFDAAYHIRDLYFPHVGQENHVGGNFCRLGLHDGATFAWVHEAFAKGLAYDDETLVSRVDLSHRELGLVLTCRDAVDFHEPILVRELRLENLRDEPREITLFLAHDFDISGNSIGDTATFDPVTEAVVHYKGARYFLLGGMGDDGPQAGLSQFAVGLKNTGGREGTWRDAEDGRLSGNSVAQGSVDSVLAVRLHLAPFGESTAYAWLCAGTSWAEVRRLAGVVRYKTPAGLITRTADYWRLWVKKESPRLEGLPDKVRRLYDRSLLVLATQLDWQGGVLAANDSDVINFNRDTYSYVWPRDGALTAAALDLAGYPEPARRFYDFVAGLIEEKGYFLHKYNPDGSLASSWHPWWAGGESQLPIQEDETALVIWALWQHFVLYRDIEFVKPLYRPLIKRAGRFMVEYRDAADRLPEPSWDLWEERRGILSFTTGAVFGGLTAAALFCTVFGEEDKAAVFRKAAGEIRDAASTHLWHEDLGRFCRMVTRGADNGLEVDETLDTSLWGLFAFGMYAPDDARIRRTMEALREKLWIPAGPGGPGGLARYEGDSYHRVDPDLPGNPWVICTLWLADWRIRTATSEAELAAAAELLGWAADHALPSGVLAEQLHPHTGEPLAVSPLTWSHATYVTMVQRALRRRDSLRKLGTFERTEDWIGRLFGQTCDAIHGACKIR